MGVSKSKELLGKYEVFPVGDVFLYRLKASNGEVLVVSEMYKNLKSALVAVETLKKNLETGTLQIHQDKHGLYQFKLFASNKRLLAASANYASEANCTSGANSFKRFASVSPVVVLENDPEHLIEEIPLNALANKKNGKLVIESIEDEFEFRLYASNGVVLCTSATYKTKPALNNCVILFKEAVKNGRFYVVKDKNNSYQFKLYTESGRCIVIGEAYKTKAQAISAANSVATFLTWAEVIDKSNKGSVLKDISKVLNVSIIGVGSRGAETYGRYFMERPDMFKITALCEIKPDRLAKYQKEFNVDESQCFVDEKDFFKEKRADVVVISTLDQDHVRHALMAIKLGYDILLEKPITCEEKELYELQKAANAKNVKILVCHVLRYTVTMEKIKELLDEKAIGELISIDHLENVAFWHQAHSFVRGNWRIKEETAPMILAKCCHDLDLLQWFANSECESLSSYGALNYFKASKAPKGATKRCMDCPHINTCPYSAYKIYIEKWKKDGSPENCWPYNVLSDEKLTEEVLLNAIKEGPYGRCVFYCDNNVVDNQSVNILFKNGITANLKMTGFNKYSGRYIHFFGTLGEIILDEHLGTISLLPYVGEDKVWKISEIAKDLRGHGGGDIRMMHYLHEMLTTNAEALNTTLNGSIQSHLMAFASEKSRLEEGKMIKVK